MVPLVTPEEMRAIDAGAPVAEEVLIERAGAALARSAMRLLGGTYARRITVLAGKGNNGADGRVAARRLRRRHVEVRVIDATDPPHRIGACDLVIDAAYGTGFHGTWAPPDVGTIPVLACDLPSGVDGLSGEARGPVLAATATTTFAALKPGLVFPPGSTSAGAVEVVDIGLDVSGARAHLVEAADVAGWLPRRTADAHKWRSGVWIVAGSPGMLGAAHLATRAAQRSGAGMVRLSSPGTDHDPMMPTEAVGRALEGDAWADDVLAELERFHALVVGPGLGRSDAAGANVRRLLAEAQLPLVVDGDGLFALSGGPAAELVRERRAPTIVTPHDGEFATLHGSPPGADRIDAARTLASELGAVVLLKGRATVVADPGGDVLVSDTGDERLATAGTGDVLSGIIGALVASGCDPFHAAAAGAWIHGRSAQLGPPRGLVAGDLPGLVPVVLDHLGDLEATP